MSDVSDEPSGKDPLDTPAPVPEPRTAGRADPADPAESPEPPESGGGGERGASADPLSDIDRQKQEAQADTQFPFGRPGQPLVRTHPFLFGFTGALGVITAWLLVQAALSARQVLVLILVSMFLAVGLNPAVQRLQQFGMSRRWAVALVFLGLVLFFAGFIAAMVPPLTQQITGFIDNLPTYISQLQSNPRIADLDQRFQLLEKGQQAITDPNFQKNLANRAVGLGKVAISSIFSALTILILTLYFLSSLPQITALFYRLTPRSRRARVALLGDEILARIGGYVGGQLTVSIIAGVSSYTFLEIARIPYALALALIVMITDLIPLIGASIGAVLVTLVGFLTGVPEGIACAAFFLVYQQVENYLIAPRVMKRSVDVQPAVTIVAALIGGTLLGVVGALLAIPAAAAISLIVREVVLPRQEQT
ncbi:MAG TPA: AI-2E family transporter [Streptosporangiaceae bacterium]|nr:AI-2E family transporter [Streptosporangiaceae bacterium]